jgi:hypothetical protein
VNLNKLKIVAAGAIIASVMSFGGSQQALASTTCTFTMVGTTMTLNSNCTTDASIIVPDGFTLDGDGYTITAVDPIGGHFLGAIIRNGGTTAHVTNLAVTASNLTDACDGDDARLRGILFDNAAGSITNNTVINVNQGMSGCQEGNGIEVRNFTTGAPQRGVTISGNTVSNYQKNGITANGAIAATILNNTVMGAGPITYIAQNGLQLGFGATGLLNDNSLSGNDYTPASYVACGILYFDAEGVRASRNMVSGNERGMCNFGKGGGQYNPNP